MLGPLLLVGDYRDCFHFWPTVLATTTELPLPPNIHQRAAIQNVIPVGWSFQRPYWTFLCCALFHRGESQ